MPGCSAVLFRRLGIAAEQLHAPLARQIDDEPYARGEQAVTTVCSSAQLHSAAAADWKLTARTKSTLWHQLFDHLIDAEAGHACTRRELLEALQPLGKADP
jgi:hypothetical protein